MEKVVQVYTIDYNSDDAAKGEWVRFAEQKKTDPVQYFYYSKVLKRNPNGTGETTVPLFTKVWWIKGKITVVADLDSENGRVKLRFPDRFFSR